MNAPEWLNSFLLDVVNVEPIVDDFVIGDEFGDVSFEEFLQFDRYFANPLVAEIVVPLDDFTRFEMTGFLSKPFSKGFLGQSFSNFGFEFFGGDPSEIEEEIIERTVEMIFPGTSREDGAAFVEGPGRDNETTEGDPRTSGESRGQVRGE